jgi:WD40 repeat protein
MNAVFSPDGKSLVTCSSDQTLKFWDITSSELTWTFKGHTEEVYDLAFSPDGRLVASVGKDGSVKLWDGSSRPSRTLGLKGILPLGFSADGSLIATTRTNLLTVFDPESLQAVSAQEFSGFDSSVPAGYSTSAFRNICRDGRTAVFPVGLEDSLSRSRKWVEAWDLSQGRLLCSIEGAEAPVAFGPKQRLLAICATNRTVSIWQIGGGTGAILSDAILPVAFSPDETMLVTCRDWIGEPLDLWNVVGADARRIATLKGDLGDLGEGVRVAFSPDSRTVATSGRDSLIRLQAIPSGHLIATLTGHKRSRIHLFFSTDGRTLASMADDGTVILWHVATGRQLMRFPIPTADIRGHDLEFSPDGRSLAAWRRDSQGELTQLWFAPSFAEIAVAEGRDYRSLAHDAVTWRAVGDALEQRNRLEEALAAFQEVAQHSAHRSDLEQLHNSALRWRANLLVRLGRLDEAGADTLAALNLPPRDPEAPMMCIDLSPYFNGTLDSESLYHAIPRGEFLRDLPRGLQCLPGSGHIKFDLRGVVQLNNNDEVPGVPRAVEGIRIGQKCRRLHFLQATHHREKHGTLIGNYVLRYADGQKEEIPIIYGKDLEDWIPDPDQVVGRQSGNVAWSGSAGHRVYTSTWENPRPDVEIASLDFASKMTRCGPFLIAVTTE